MSRTRIAAWAALLAMALHALSPLAAPAPRDAAGLLHDICSSAPAAPQPAGDPSTSHCALCVPSASVGATSVVLAVFAFDAEDPLGHVATPSSRPSYRLPTCRAPPAGA